MPQIERYPVGSFCWVELGTTDQDAAKAFYTALFGWQVVDMPMGPAGNYSMFYLGGGDVGAAYTLFPEMRQAGIPPNWTLYVAVDNVDETARRVKELGGKVCKEPFDVFDVGRMAVIQDPTGASFCLWQPRNPGKHTVNEKGTLCWGDLNTSDPSRAQSFYSDLLGWKFEKSDKGHDYMHIKNGDQYIGGMPMENHGLPPHWLPYFEVADSDASTEKCKSMGGGLNFGPMTLEGVGKFSVLGDPQGAVFAVFQGEMK